MKNQTLPLKYYLELKKKLKKGAYALGVVLLLLFAWELFVPCSLAKAPSAVYVVQNGEGNKEIATDLKKLGIVRNSLFFRWYVAISGQYAKLQAGKYSVSSSASVFSLVKKFASGDVIKNRVTVIEGWDAEDISSHLQDIALYKEEDFLKVLQQDFNSQFDFLGDKPKDAGLEGYLFPDTYEVSLRETPEEMVQNILANFDRKLTPDIRKEISSQGKSIFQIITMASMIEKEVGLENDKKIVSGILWKRLASGMPLQADATINYITGSNSGKGVARNTGVDSPYNTYKYRGLPRGPISNPGMESILASIYPKESDYWYYLSAQSTGKTIFSATFQE